MPKEHKIIKQPPSLHEVIDMDKPLIDRIVFKLKQYAQKKYIFDNIETDCESHFSKYRKGKCGEFLYYDGEENGEIKLARKILDQFSIKYQIPKKYIKKTKKSKKKDIDAACDVDVPSPDEDAQYPEIE
jgi:hypothetical protein